MERIKTFFRAADWKNLGIVCYYAFFAINVLMKAFSYDHGDNIYRCFLLVAMIFWGIKMVTTRYTYREIFWIAILFATGLMLSVINRQNTWLLLFITIAGMKNCRFHILALLAVYIRVISLAILIAGSVLGIYNIGYKITLNSDYVETPVYSFAMLEPNTAFLTVFLALILLLYYNYKKLNLWWFLGTSAVAVIFYEFTFCRTGIAVFFFCWALIVFEKLNKNRKAKFVLALSVPVGAIFSLIMMVIYDGNRHWMYQINHLVSGRIYIMNTYYKDQGISLIPRTQEIFYTSYHGLVDNSYMFVFLYCGIIIAVAAFILVTKTLFILYRKGHYKELVMIAAMALYGVLEQYVMNGFMNIFILLCGILLYPKLLDGEDSKSITS